MPLMISLDTLRFRASKSYTSVSAVEQLLLSKACRALSHTTTKLHFITCCRLATPLGKRLSFAGSALRTTERRGQTFASLACSRNIILADHFAAAHLALSHHANAAA